MLRIPNFLRILELNEPMYTLIHFKPFFMLIMLVFSIFSCLNNGQHGSPVIENDLQPASGPILEIAQPDNERMIPELPSIGKSHNKAQDEESEAFVAPEVSQRPEDPAGSIMQGSALATAVEEILPVDQEGTSESPDHQLFNQLLNSYVDDKGKVDYAGIKNDLVKLDEYINVLRQNHPEAGWSRSQKLAYWINAYNAFTIKLILDHFPISSITRIETGKPWDKEWIKLGTKTYSLNQIENDIIRPQFNDPRIHFAVNCAAKSCPPLANEAFTEVNLDQLLERQTKSFINDQNYNSISQNNAKISKIFEWYSADFGDLITFINKYSKVPLNSSAKIEFQEYNWDLNKQ
jgi:hypothetical protein